jgi:hypothetical protein
MKKILITLAILMAFAFTINKTYSDFSDGWDNGYCVGWKSIKGQFTVCPVSPVAPVPNVGEDNYDWGFARGYDKGKSDASN